jgi:hypothetical protein
MCRCSLAVTGTKSTHVKEKPATTSNYLQQQRIPKQYLLSSQQSYFVSGLALLMGIHNGPTHQYHRSPALNCGNRNLISVTPCAQVRTSCHQGKRSYQTRPMPGPWNRRNTKVKHFSSEPDDISVRCFRSWKILVPPSTSYSSLVISSISRSSNKPIGRYRGDGGTPSNFMPSHFESCQYNNPSRVILPVRCQATSLGVICHIYIC